VTPKTSDTRDRDHTRASGLRVRTHVRAGANRADIIEIYNKDPVAH
jgi:hypothetical protein